MQEYERAKQWCAIASFVVAFGIGCMPTALGANGSVVYTYDALGRIATASYDTGVIIIYTYDANGNRTSQIINVNSGTLTWSATTTPCTSNCWGAARWQ